MPIYKYKVLTRDGAKKDGAILADDYKSVYDSLRAKLYSPIEITKARFISNKVDLEDLSAFFSHINFQLKCGVRINEAIDSFADCRGNKILNATLLDVSNSLKNGESLGESFQKRRFVFSDAIVGLLKALEDSGDATEIISNVLNFLKLQSDWQNNVKRAIAYPIFITIVAAIVLILVAGILGPQVASLIQSCDEVPTFARFAADATPVISNAIVLFLTTLFAVVPLLRLTKTGKNFLSRATLKTPKIGELIVKISIWRFCKILSAALKAKLDFIRAFDLAIEAVKFSPLENELKDIRDNIADGYKIAESFSEGRLIPREIIAAVYIGEEGNDLPESLNRAAENQYKEILFDIKSLGQILSVGLTLFTGLIFILILCGLFYPIYNYVEIAGL
ncbi:MAG: type II secretion system F family protein [Holosporaceae bacterium]|jgi:type IV pilus assembly protein PilC|nr:type II secretion system F family protein [Holosporaceae bacterium]